MKDLTTSKISLALFALLFFSFSFAQEEEKIDEKSQKQVLLDMLHKMDENKNGKLTLGEAKGTLLLNFTTLDANKDGILTREDLEEFKLSEKPTPQ